MFCKFFLTGVSSLQTVIPLYVQTESEGADHCGGISLGGAWFWRECTAQHQREQAVFLYLCSLPMGPFRYCSFGGLCRVPIVDLISGVGTYLAYFHVSVARYW